MNLCSISQLYGTLRFWGVPPNAITTQTILRSPVHSTLQPSPPVTSAQPHAKHEANRRANSPAPTSKGDRMSSKYTNCGTNPQNQRNPHIPNNLQPKKRTHRSARQTQKFDFPILPSLTYKLLCRGAAAISIRVRNSGCTGKPNQRGIAAEIVPLHSEAGGWCDWAKSQPLSSVSDQSRNADGALPGSDAAFSLPSHSIPKNVNRHECF